MQALIIFIVLSAELLGQGLSGQPHVVKCESHTVVNYAKADFRLRNATNLMSVIEEEVRTLGKWEIAYLQLHSHWKPMLLSRPELHNRRYSTWLSVTKAELPRIAENEAFVEIAKVGHSVRAAIRTKAGLEERWWTFVGDILMQDRPNEAAELAFIGGISRPGLADDSRITVFVRSRDEKSSGLFSRVRRLAPNAEIVMRPDGCFGGFYRFSVASFFEKSFDCPESSLDLTPSRHCFKTNGIWSCHDIRHCCPK